MKMSYRFTINTGYEKLWRKINNVYSLGQYISEIDAIHPFDEDMGEYVVWFKIETPFYSGRFQSKMYVNVDEIDKKIVYSIKNRFIDVESSIDLLPKDSSTIVTFDIQTRVKNPLGKLIEQILMDKINSYREKLEGFLNNLE